MECNIYVQLFTIIVATLHMSMIIFDKYCYSIYKYVQLTCSYYLFTVVMYHCYVVQGLPVYFSAFSVGSALCDKIKLCAGTS